MALLAPLRAQSDATVLKDGEVVYDVSVGYITASKFFDNNGRTRTIGCEAKYGDYTHNFEYGYSQYFTWMLGASLGVTSCDDPGDQGLDDVKLGFRVGVRPVRGDEGSSAVTVLASIPADPDAKREVSRSRLSCGTFSVLASVDRAAPLGETVTASYGAGLQLNEAPLAHQANVQLSLAKLLSPRWGVTVGVAGNTPITELPTETDATRFVNAVVAQCGTQASAVTATLGLSRKLSKSAQAGCGGTYTVAGEQVTQALGLSCSYSFTWK